MPTPTLRPPLSSLLLLGLHGYRRNDLMKPTDPGPRAVSKIDGNDDSMQSVFASA